MTGWLIGTATVVVGLWVAFAAVLWLVRPEETRMRDLVGLLPDLARSTARLACDPDVPRSRRMALWLLLGYLALPLDLVPDFLPVVGWADDVIIAVVVIGWVWRSTPATKLARHWPGDPEGLATVMRLVTR